MISGSLNRAATYLVDSTLHWANILNGFSGAEPLGYKQTMQMLDQIPSASALELLNKYGVNILAVHSDLKPERKQEIKDYFLKSDRVIIQNVNPEQFLVILKADTW